MVSFREVLKFEALWQEPVPSQLSGKSGVAKTHGVIQERTARIRQTLQEACGFSADICGCKCCLQLIWIEGELFQQVLSVERAKPTAMLGTLRCDMMIAFPHREVEERA